MKARPYFPLLAKVLGWLLLHLLVLTLAFIGFLDWQLGLGLDSLLSGAAGQHLQGFGDSAREKILHVPRSEWSAAVAPLALEKKVTAVFFDFNDPSFATVIPANVLARAKMTLPPPPVGPPGRPANRRPPPREFGGPPPEGGPPEEGERPPPENDFGDPGPFEGMPPEVINGARSPNPLPSSRPVFLVRGNHGDGYWAGIQMVLPGVHGPQFRHELLLVRAEGLDGSGMFFDFKPWLLGGLAVLALSLAFWTPFVWAITRYIRQLTVVTDHIAAGQFKVSLPPRGNDELANLGHAIESMAGRLDHLVSGQKRFLGDAAHELCAPLARLRTGLGILEMKIGEAEKDRLCAIETDAQELATLVEEILAFSRAGNRAPRMQTVLLEPLIRRVAARESGERPPEINIQNELAATADPTLLARALGNLVRNARIHGGSNALIAIAAIEIGGWVEITVTDDGPGISPDELGHLFEPFYRADRSRSRDTGGSGLGLAIVRTAIEACGGQASASLPPAGGFSVMIRLAKSLPGER